MQQHCHIALLEYCRVQFLILNFCSIRLRLAQSSSHLVFTVTVSLMIHYISLDSANAASTSGQLPEGAAAVRHSFFVNWSAAERRQVRSNAVRHSAAIAVRWNPCSNLLLHKTKCRKTNFSTAFVCMVVFKCTFRRSSSISDKSKLISLIYIQIRTELPGETCK